MDGWRAFRSGLARTLRYPQVLLVLFAVNLVTALLLAALPALILASGPGQTPAIHQAADGVDAWMVIETLLSPLANAAQEQTGVDLELASGLRGMVLLGLATAAALPFVAWLPSAFLNGGLLMTYAESPQPFRWRRFLGASWRWWGVFLLLGAVQGILTLVVLLPLAIAAAVGMVALGGWLAWVAIPGLVSVAWVGLALLEYTRAFCVVDGTRHVWRAFGRAVRLVFRRPLAVGVLYGLALLLSALLQAIYHLGLMPHIPLDRWPLVLAVQQAFIVAQLGTRLVRLAGGVTMVAESGRAETNPL